MSTIRDKLEILLQYFQRNRGVGHTTVMVRGVADSENVVVLAHDYSFHDVISTLCGKKVDVVTLNTLDELIGRNTPLVIDNGAMTLLLRDALFEITTLTNKCRKYQMLLNSIKFQLIEAELE